MLCDAGVGDRLPRWALSGGSEAARSVLAGRKLGSCTGGELDLWEETGWESVVQWVNTNEIESLVDELHTMEEEIERERERETLKQ